MYVSLLTQLDKTLQQRREHKKKSAHVRDRHAKQARRPAAVEDGEEDDEEAAPGEEGASNVDEFLRGGFQADMGDSEEEDDDDDAAAADDGDDDDDDRLDDMEDVSGTCPC